MTDRWLNVIANADIRDALIAPDAVDRHRQFHDD
jgi:hypothetical protein